MELVALVLVMGWSLAVYVVGVRHGREIEAEAQTVQRRIDEISYFGPRTYQTLTDGPKVEAD